MNEIMNELIYEWMNDLGWGVSTILDFYEGRLWDEIP